MKVTFHYQQCAFSTTIPGFLDPSKPDPWHFIASHSNTRAILKYFKDYLSVISYLKVAGQDCFAMGKRFSQIVVSTNGNDDSSLKIAFTSA